MSIEHIMVTVSKYIHLMVKYIYINMLSNNYKDYKVVINKNLRNFGIH